MVGRSLSRDRSTLSPDNNTDDIAVEHCREEGRMGLLFVKFNCEGRQTTTGKEQCLCTEVNVYVVYILSTVKTENTYTLARLDALFKSSQSSPFGRSWIRSPIFRACDRVLGPSRCFVKRSAVLFFVFTRSTERRFSHGHCCKPSIVFRHV